jgi:hypothetical protein
MELHFDHDHNTHVSPVSDNRAALDIIYRESFPSGAVQRHPTTEPQPLDFDVERDLRRFESLVEGFITSMGTPTWDGVLQQISLAAGIDVNDIERSLTIHGVDATARPWRWLLLGAQAANTANDYGLVLKASGVVSMWQLMIAPKLNERDLFEVGLADCPPDVEIEFYRLALDPAVAVSIPDDAVLATDSNGIAITAEQLRTGCQYRMNDLGGDVPQ